jgi:hypothetical protein
MHLSPLLYTPVDIALAEVEAGTNITAEVVVPNASTIEAVLAALGPPIEAAVVDDGTPPFAKRVTVKCECRCGEVLGRYSGGLRLTATLRGGIPRIRLGDDGVFVTNCQRQTCKIRPKRWPYDLLATELRDAWDHGRRRFTMT